MGQEFVPFLISRSAGKQKNCTGTCCPSRTERPNRSPIWQRLTDFYAHCAESRAAQLRRLAWTVNAGQSPSLKA
jgi:hypothetical protein